MKTTDNMTVKSKYSVLYHAQLLKPKQLILNSQTAAVFYCKVKKI